MFEPGYVAFLDVLGFSEITRSQQRLGEYLQCLQTIAPGNARYVVFSDSIVLTIKGLERYQFFELCRVTSKLMWQLLVRDFPVRGAIAAGEFERSEIGSGNAFVAGTPIVEAYRYEQLQDWVGIMIAPSARKLIPDLEGLCGIAYPENYAAYAVDLLSGEPMVWRYVRQYAIPCKPDDHEKRPTHIGFAILPTNGDAPPDMVRDLAEARKHLDWMHAIAPTPAEQRKYVESSAFVGAAWAGWENFKSDMYRKAQSWTAIYEATHKAKVPQ